MINWVLLGENWYRPTVPLPLLISIPNENAIEAVSSNLFFKLILEKNEVNIGLLKGFCHMQKA